MHVNLNEKVQKRSEITMSQQTKFEYDWSRDTSLHHILSYKKGSLIEFAPN